MTNKYQTPEVKEVRKGDYAGNVCVTKDGTKTTVSIFGGLE